MSKESTNQNSKYENLVAQGPEAYVSELEKTNWFSNRPETPQEFVNQLKTQTVDQSFCERLVDFNFFDTDIDGHGDPENYKKMIITLLEGTLFPLDSVEVKYNQEKEELFLSIKTTTNHIYEFSFVPFNIENLELADVVEKFLNKILSKEGLAEEFFNIPEKDSSST